MENLTEREVEAISALLMAEGLACKKARMYSHTLTDSFLAEELSAIAEDHEERYKRLYAMLGGVL